jgi:hypothetical protein
MISDDERQRLEILFASLPERERKIAYMRHISLMTQREVEARSGIGISIIRKVDKKLGKITGIIPSQINAAHKLTTRNVMRAKGLLKTATGTKKQMLELYLGGKMSCAQIDKTLGLTPRTTSTFI